MEHYFQAVAAVLMTVILVLCLRKNQSGIGEMLSLLVCAMVIVCASSYIEPVINFADRIQQLGMVDSQMLKILFKVVGVCVTAEITELLCNDSGNAALGKTIQFLASAVVICMSLPLLESLLELIEGVLNEL